MGWEGKTTEKEEGNKVKIAGAGVKSTKTREIEFEMIGSLKTQYG